MTNFELHKSIEILQRTPAVLEALFIGVSEEWLRKNEGTDTWSPYNIVGHYIHNEVTDWIPRISIILSDSENKIFEPFDRLGHFQYNQTLPINNLLTEFRNLREKSLQTLSGFEIDELMLAKTGVHPAFGEVNLQQLIAAWVVHDLGHIGQITRVMAKQYKNEVGPWVKYLGVLHK